jgi:hypothetical protein
MCSDFFFQVAFDMMMAKSFNNHSGSLDIVFPLLDRNRDGVIDQDEFIEAIASFCPEVAIPENLSGDSLMRSLFFPSERIRFFGSSVSLPVDRGSKSVGIRYSEMSNLISNQSKLGWATPFFQEVASSSKKLSDIWLTSEFTRALGNDIEQIVRPLNSASTTKTPHMDHLVFAGISAAIARSAVAPFERLKILYQLSPQYSNLREAMKDMWSNGGGLRGLFRTNGLNMARVSSTFVVQGYMLQKIRDYQHGHSLTGDSQDARGSVSSLVIAGGTAAVLANLFTLPFETARARMAIQRDPKNWTGIWATLKNASLKNNLFRPSVLFSGLIPTSLYVFCYVGSDITLFEHWKDFVNAQNNFGQWAAKQTEVDLTPWLLICGSATMALAQTVAYPFDIVRRRMQIEGRSPKRFSWRNSRMVSILQSIYQSQGFRGFYRGASLNFVKAVPSVTVAFFVYEHLRKQNPY